MVLYLIKKEEGSSRSQGRKDDNPQPRHDDPAVCCARKRVFVACNHWTTLEPQEKYYIVLYL